MNGIESTQQRQFQQWAGDVSELLQKMGSNFSELRDSTQSELRNQAQEIARMRDDVERSQRNATERFEALAARYRGGGGGTYEGAFASREAAEGSGKALIATLTGDRAGMQTAGISPGEGSDGGFLMPEPLMNAIVRNVEDYGVFERNADVMGGLGTTSGHITKRTGGLTCYHPDLGVATDDSEPSFGRIRYNMTRYSALTYVDRWMLASDLAVALAEFVAREIAQTLAYSQDVYGFTGDGSASHAGVQGIFNRAATDQLTITGASGDDTYQELIDKHVSYLAQCIGKLPRWAHDEAKFYMHLSIFAGYLGVRLTSGAPIADILASEAPAPFRLMGYPVEIVQVAPTLSDVTQADQTMAVFGNLRRAWKIMRHRTGIEIRSSEHVKFAEGQIAILGDAMQDMVEADNQAYVQLRTDS